MFLKKIEIQGFKSFAEKTVLEFGGGVTSIVGPNGSGKSNISDAIRWVMGEMSIKSLRGASMQDVIFAGTASRKPLNFAQVSLILDNNDRTLPIDFSEVTVSRRVFRSGESEYCINGAACRLKDIHELFMDTGLGRDGYSIVGQGNVAQILSTKAEDRRTLFEEAAGVSKYKHKRDEARRKLDATNENLTRVEDIISELEAQLEPLARQSEKARKYLDLYEKYKKLDISICISIIKKNNLAMSELEGLYAGVTDELEILREKEDDAEKMLSDLYEQSSAKDKSIEDMNSRLRTNESEIMNLEKERGIAENSIKSNMAMIERINAEILDLERKKSEYIGQIDEINDEIRKYDEDRQAAVNEQGVLAEKVKESERGLSEYKNKIDSLQGDIIAFMNEISSGKAKMSGIDNLRNSFLKRREAVENEIAGFSENIKSINDKIESCRTQIDEKTEKLSSIKTRVEKLQAKKQELSYSLNEKIAYINNIRIKKQEKISRKNMLVEMENSYEGYAKSVKLVLTAKELKNRDIFGAVSSIIGVRKQYVTAIETAVGGALQNIVVGDEEDAKAAIAYLKKVNGGRATFLPVSSVSGKGTLPSQLSECNGFIGSASGLVECDRKYGGIIDSLLGRTAVVDNIDNAVLISRKFGYKFRIVTLDGDIINSGGSMTGGSINRSSGFLSRANNIKELSDELLVIADSERAAEIEKKTLESDFDNIRLQLETYIPVMREYEDELIKLENTAIHLENSAESSAKSNDALANELEQINSQLSQTGEDIGILIGKLAETEGRVKKAEVEAEILQSEYDKAAENKSRLSESMTDMMLRISAIEKDISVCREKIRDLNKRIEENEADITKRGLDRQAIESENEALQTTITEKTEHIDNMHTLSEGIKNTISALAQEKNSIMDKLKQIQSSNKELTDRVVLLQQEKSRLEARKENLEAEHDTAVNRLWDEYELPYSEAEKSAEAIDNEKDAAKQAGEIKSKMKALGSVNLGSVEEYKSVKERFEFLSTQKADLDQSRKNLNKIIQTTQELMEENFERQFAEINKSFEVVFKEMFGGGRGRLYLLEPDNILGSGIEIEVQLPGKGLQNINLYSGGEKSFIAIALLFAIINVKPAPFCILDEIDAALDDVNVSRFATYLKNYFTVTQFIVITHRRGTMEASDMLYGVTMQEKGVSKLLSLHIDDVDSEMAK